MKSKLLTALLTAALAGQLAIAQTATLGDLPETAQVATNAAVLADIVAATNAIPALIEAVIAHTNAYLIVSNKTLSVWAATGQVEEAVEIWKSDQIELPDLPDFETWYQWITGIQQALAGKADKAWGKYAPDGSDNPEPSLSVFVNTAALMLASGMQWATDGDVAVMAASGTQAFISDNGGEFRMGPDLTDNYRGFLQGGSFLVGAIPQGIKKYDDHVEIVYQYSGGDFPAIHGTADLLVKFSEVLDVVWRDNHDGTATAICPAPAGRFFYKALTTASVGYWEFSTMPNIFYGGIAVSTNTPPVIYDSVITITVGGRNYKVLAEEVQ